MKVLMWITAFVMSGIMAGELNAQSGPGPEILILGDSQIPNGAGVVYQGFFEDLVAQCSPTARQERRLERKLGAARVGAIGVRSTSLHSWTARSGASKDTICEVDKKWGVNAGTLGIEAEPKVKFVQIGKGDDYQFCEPGRSAFEVMFDEGGYAPKLLIMSFLGNAIPRWSDEPELALLDVERTMAQLPARLPCVVMSTAPVFKESVNRKRVVAQENVAAAFEKAGSRCVFIPAMTPRTREIIEGNPQYFSRREDGTVRDPLHPSTRALRKFVEINRPAICRAVFDVLR